MIPNIGIVIVIILAAIVLIIIINKTPNKKADTLKDSSGTKANTLKDSSGIKANTRISSGDNTHSKVISRKGWRYIFFIVLSVVILLTIKTCGIFYADREFEIYQYATQGEPHHVYVKIEEPVFLGKVASYSTGSFVITDSNLPNLMDAKWPAHPSGGANWGPTITYDPDYSSSRSFSKGEIEANIDIINMRLDVPIIIKGYLKIKCITPIPKGNGRYSDTIITAHSETIDIHINPVSEMKIGKVLAKYHWVLGGFVILLIIVANLAFFIVPDEESDKQ